jgi:hypothetical protein
MNPRRLTICGFSLLVSVAICTINTSAQSFSVSAQNANRVRVGQLTAISDFDSDGFIDEARIEGSGFHKSVGILLSRTGKRSFLHFRPGHSIDGSLLVSDLDNDGATDLIWADALHCGDVAVWLGDGRGRFEHVDSSQYFSEFVFGDPEIAPPDGSNEETVFISETNRPLDQNVNQKSFDRIASNVSNSYTDQPATPSPALGQLTGRDPPAFPS